MTRNLLSVGLFCLFLLSPVPPAVSQSGAADDSASGSGTIASRLSVELSGSAIANRITHLAVTPAAVDSGLVEIGESRLETIRLSHTGAGDADPITIGAAQLTGPNADEYSTDFAGSLTLYPGESITITLQLTPVFTGTKSAALTLDIAEASAPYVLLLDAWSRYPLTSTLGDDAGGDPFSLGPIIEGENATGILTVVNQGESDAPAIALNDVLISGTHATAWSTDFTPASLLPGEELDIAITLSSAVEGSKQAELIILHDGANPSLNISLEGEVQKPAAVDIEFGRSTLAGASIDQATSLQFGPDERLYVCDRDGLIHVYEVTRQGKNDYSANKVETITLVKNVQNYNDDGSVKSGLTRRLVTGMHIAGTASSPVIYIASADPRQAAGPSGTDSGLDTNSGILHKLSQDGTGWTKQDLVRGLPRSEENHVPNGLVLMGNKVLLLIGGHTNQGVPSNNFAQLPEYALSAALLEIDLGAIGNGTYDLPTLDDEDRPGIEDANDPFGGNNGKNQAKLVANGPVSLYATGFRNAYDIVLTEAGRLYTIDNGPNTGWGGTPAGSCLNQENNGGSTHKDNLHLITRGLYAGHPNPTRGNKANTFNSDGQSPIDIAANPEECIYKEPGNGDGALMLFPKSTNGLTEYTASNFGAAMQGDLLAAAFGKSIYRIQLNTNGTAVTSSSKLFTDVGQTPLDITAQGDGDVFPGTLWVVDYAGENITVFEPVDY